MQDLHLWIMSLSQCSGGHRAQATRIMNENNTELKTDSPSGDVLEGLGELLNQKALITDYDTQILETLDNSEHINEEISNSSDIKMMIDATVRKMKRTLGNLFLTGGDGGTLPNPITESRSVNYHR